MFSRLSMSTLASVLKLNNFIYTTIKTTWVSVTEVGALSAADRAWLTHATVSSGCGWVRRINIILVIFHPFSQKPRHRGQVCIKFGTAVGVADMITCDKFFGDRFKGC